MAVAKTKPAPESEAEAKTEVESTDEKPVTKSDVVEIVKEAVAGLIPGKETTTTTETETEVETGKPMTAREEEARTHNIVAEAIKVFKEEVLGTGEKAETKKETETQPGAKTTRWIERVLWGKE